MFSRHHAPAMCQLAAGTATALLLVAFGAVGPVAVHASPKAPTETVDVTILTPRDGLTLNAPTVDFQALVSARRAGRSDDDVWTGWTRVDLAIDGVLAQSLDPAVCRGQIAAGFRLDLASLAPGPHTATITGSKKTRGSLVQGSASLRFRSDPALPVRETNRVEAAATPTPFACLSTPDFDPDDDDRADDYDSRLATFRGSFVPNALSAGLDLAHDRVVLAIDDQTVAIEPGSFVCRAHNRCRFTDNRGGLVRSVRLEQKKRGRWTFTIATRRRPSPSRSLFLRIGSNWGALDYVNDQYVAALAPALDTVHRATATIGPAGGSVQTTDAGGVVTQLIVPAGALTRDTLITATPLAAAPLVGQAPGLHLGVKFEPEGLVFALPATLVLDFAAAARAPADGDFVYLVTSPMTRIPLVGNGRIGSILTAQLPHFSTVQADGLAPVFGNLVDWDPRLTDVGAATFTELAQIAEAVRVQLASGCTTTQECAAVDAALNDLIQTTSASIDALIPSCSGDVANPTRAAFDHWKMLISLAQGLGLSDTALLDCTRNVLDALVTKVGADGLAHPTDAAVDSLNDLENQAVALAFSPVATRAHTKKHDVLSAVIDQAGGVAAVSPSVTTLQRMIGLRARAQGFAFADLERRALEKSVAAARAAISRLQQACDADAQAPATDLAKELARTWVAFVNQDPTVAPTLAADFRQVVDNCGGNFVTVVGGQQYETGIGLTTYRLLDQNANAPVQFLHSDSSGAASMLVSVAGKTIAVDITADVANFFQAFATLDFQFPKSGTLVIDINHGWLTGFEPRLTAGALEFVRGPGGYLINNCLSATCSNVSPLPVPGAPATVVVPVPVGSYRVQIVLTAFGSITGSGRAMTVTYTPTP